MAYSVFWNINEKLSHAFNLADESDCDDVVWIKEEIEVDSEDVIFLSETKPDPPPATENGGDKASGKTALSETHAQHFTTFANCG